MQTQIHVQNMRSRFPVAFAISMALFVVASAPAQGSFTVFGKGCIGKQGFAHFVNDKRFAGVPMILETPKGKDGRGTDLDKVNLKRLRSLVHA